MQYWIVVGSPDNFNTATQRGFDLFGFKSTRRRESGEMRPGDKLIFYLTGDKTFGGMATVKSEAFEDHKKIFSSEKKPGEDYPFRVKTKPDIILPADRRLDVTDFVPQLEMTRKGAMKSWGMAFQGNLHKVSETDGKLLEKEMNKRSKKMPSKTKVGAKVKMTAKRGGTTGKQRTRAAASGTARRTTRSRTSSSRKATARARR